MYPTASDLVRASVQIPVILYTAEQIFVGQFMVWYFKRWLARDKAKRAQEELERERSISGGGSEQVSAVGRGEEVVDGEEEGTLYLGKGEPGETGNYVSGEKN